MEQIHITLPDGSVQEVPKGTTPADIARKISPRLADAALVARVAQPASGKDAPENNGEGELIDLRRPLDHDVSLQILTEKDPDALFVFRHSAAHLLAAAVMEQMRGGMTEDEERIGILLGEDLQAHVMVERPSQVDQLAFAVVFRSVLTGCGLGDAGDKRGIGKARRNFPCDIGRSRTLGDFL